MELTNLLSELSRLSKYSNVYIEENYLVVIDETGYIAKIKIPKR